MGKYIRKTKLTGDVVAVMDVSQPTLGVRTRATTLALQKLQSTPPTEHHRELSYLQLRSRKLEKPPLPQLTCRKHQNPNPRPGTLKLPVRASGSGSAGPSSSNKEFEIKPEGDFGTEEASFGGNNYDLDGRNTRESTPCSFTRESNDSITPGSSTRMIGPNSIQRIMPSTEEIEEFFACHAQEQQRLFSEKYNFDIVNEKPIQGRYEWVRVQP
ncbi:cyclin-dependent kinase inhibitor 3-like [Bidens hawaiensis]|uniref:cyclin-dependent kinase inhibitor 3-like n=1 Tax=Bidens hawaiensis TaxID=980011 RepID=UPI00404A59C6